MLDGVSFTAPERSLTALVGPSGAGKTTVTRLLMRYADPQAGVIRIGGMDIRGMRPETLSIVIGGSIFVSKSKLNIYLTHFSPISFPSAFFSSQ